MEKSTNKKLKEELSRIQTIVFKEYKDNKMSPKEAVDIECQIRKLKNMIDEMTYKHL